MFKNPIFMPFSYNKIKIWGTLHKMHYLKYTLQNTNRYNHIIYEYVE